MRIAVPALAVMLAGMASAFAQNPGMDMFNGPEGLKWGPAPPGLPKGAQIAVLSGDPGTTGSYVLRLKLPANYQIPAHHHPTTENLTVLSGELHAGMGDKLDTKNGQAFEPGGFASMPANMNHYAWATTETVIQLHGNGPFAIVYVNDADDPRKGQ